MNKRHKYHRPEHNTVAEAIQHSVEFYDEDILEEIDGEVRVTGSRETLSIVFETMLFSFANVIVQLLIARMRTVKQKKLTIDDLMEALHGNNLLTHFSVWADLHEFLAEWLRMDISALCDEETFNTWYDFTTIARVYNKFALRDSSDQEDGGDDDGQVDQQ